MNEHTHRDHRVEAVLLRLEAIVDAENAAIGSDPKFDLRQSNAVKSRCLYDMTMLFKGINPDRLDHAHLDHLKTVKAKLDVNSLKVGAHMEAVRDIAELIKGTVTESEADGTYSADQFRAYDLS
ncbi:hypothetical protein IMCC20628_03440 [Hoeflea sp. IMCC20628]|uniref:hypothetical protein n=1 Tax=Hoeflea sp. IMCC20628 TaxID=1620421 RepID=UPI00063AA42B|nr:hypothetical protein [Hoeflea sp. IMCC20628]AKI02129.1 hypothetical protein IMCC20628_03440 [Hoeflea sp. IMCC20628]